MDFKRQEGKTSYGAAEAIFHDPVATPQRGRLLGPANSHIDHVDGKDMVTGTPDATVMDCDYLELPWLLFVPRNPFHRDLPGCAIGLSRAFWEAGGAHLAEADSCDASLLDSAVAPMVTNSWRAQKSSTVSAGPTTHAMRGPGSPYALLGPFMANTSSYRPQKDGV
jgi:hypothetical protein